MQYTTNLTKVYIFSTVILASQSSRSLSPLGVAMRLSQLPIGSFYLFKMLFSACSLSLSLATLALLTVSASDVLDLRPPAHPPFFILLLIHLFSGGRDAYVDRATCFKCHKLGHWARECTATWDSARSAYRGTAFTPGYSEQAVFKNNRSSFQYAQFVEEAIRDLVESGHVVQTKVPPRVVNP